MTKLWRQSQAEEDRTEAFVTDSDWVADFDHALGVSRWQAGDSSSPATVEIESEHPPDDYFDALDMFVVSDRLKRLLEEFDVHVEYLPLRVIYMGKEYEDEAFYCCNILDAVDCFDFERGECTFHQTGGFTDHIDKIKKLAIDEEKASPYHLFCIAKGGEYIVCVSDALASRITASGLTGMRFVEPEAWPAC